MNSSKFFFMYTYKHDFNGRTARVLHFVLSGIWNFIWQRQIFLDARWVLPSSSIYSTKAHSSAASLRAYVVLLFKQTQVYKFNFGKLSQKWEEAFPSNLILSQKSLQIKKG